MRLWCNYKGTNEACSTQLNSTEAEKRTRSTDWPRTLIVERNLCMGHLMRHSPFLRNNFHLDTSRFENKLGGRSVATAGNRLLPPTGSRLQPRTTGSPCSWDQLRNCSTREESMSRPRFLRAVVLLSAFTTAIGVSSAHRQSTSEPLASPSPLSSRKDRASSPGSRHALRSTSTTAWTGSINAAS